MVSGCSSFWVNTQRMDFVWIYAVPFPEMLPQTQILYEFSRWWVGG